MSDTMMYLSEPVVFPELFRETCEQFLTAYWNDRLFEMQNVFGLYDLPIVENVNRLMIADTLLQIAKAAAGETEHLDTGEVYECVQSLCEHLFAAPGIGAAYRIPQEFWDAPIGQMVNLAFIWARGDELVTLSEAAEISGKSLSTLSQMISRGKLQSYPDPREPNPQKRNRLLRSDVESLASA